jgi:hypothetical protein
MTDYHWNNTQKRLFVEAFAETGCVSEACNVAGKSRRSAYNLRRRGDGVAFRAGWDAAVLIARDCVNDALMERVLLGQRLETIRDPSSGTTIRTHYDQRLSMALLTRLDRMADQDAEICGSGADYRSRSQVISQNFDAFVNLIEAGGAASDVEDFLIKHRPDANARHQCELAEKSAGSPEEIAEQEAAGLSVWFCEDNREWRTDFPPPPGFIGEEDCDFGKGDYSRSLSDQEEAIQDARREAESVPFLAAATRARDAVCQSRRMGLWTCRQSAVSDKRLSLNQLHQPPFNRRKHGTKLMAAPDDHTMFAEQDPLPLFQPERRAFFKAKLRPLGRAAEGAKGRDVFAHLDGVIAPMTSGDHATVKVENAVELCPVKSDLTNLWPGKLSDNPHQAPDFLPLLSCCSVSSETFL